MSKWAYVCCELDLHEYTDDDVAGLLALNAESEEDGEGPLFHIFDTREEALASIGPPL